MPSLRLSRASMSATKGKGGSSAGTGTGPMEAPAASPVGSALAGIGFIGDIVAEAEGGAPIKAIAPCEGTVYEIGALSVIKGAPNLDNARKFVDWALGPKAQALIAKAGHAYPANATVASSPLAPKWSEIKFIDYDAATYEKSAARARLTDRWSREFAPAAH